MRQVRSVVSRLLLMPSKRLNCPYYAQNDNEPYFSDGAGGNTQCNATSHSMLLAYLLPDFVSKSKANGFKEPESYFKSKLEKSWCGRGDHNCYSQVLENDFGIKSEWRTDLSKQDLMRSIDAGIPMVVGVNYKLAGHILIATGYDNSGVYINDSYGERNGASDSYSYINPGYGDQHGKDDLYSWGLMSKLWSTGSDGWGRVIKEIRGKRTGL